MHKRMRFVNLSTDSNDSAESFGINYCNYAISYNIKSFHIYAHIHQPNISYNPSYLNVL